MSRTPKGLTRERVFTFVRERLLMGLPPTVRDVQRALGFKAVETARGHLDTLLSEGKLAKEPGVSRGYRLPESSFAPSLLVPLLGRVQAGALTLATEEVQEFIPVSSRLPSAELFALQVRGDSMSQAGILHGDVVIVKKQPSAENGEIVVALVGEEATVKRLRVIAGRIELHPDNPSFAPIVPDPSSLSILGRVIEVRRQLK